jgi:hypothetical protein
MKTFYKFTFDLMTDVLLKLISSFFFCFNFEVVKHNKQMNTVFFYFEVVQHRVVTSHRAEQRQRRLARRAEQLVELRRKEPGDILMTI